MRLGRERGWRPAKLCATALLDSSRAMRSSLLATNECKYGQHGPLRGNNSSGK